MFRYDRQFMPRRLLLLLAGVTLLYAALLAAVARSYGWNASCFLHIGGKTLSQDHADLPSGLVLYTDSYGYDGLHYYQLARDPFLLSPEEAAPFKTDRFFTRLQRVLFPALAWAAAGGDDGRIPAAMLAVNLAAVLLAAALLFRIGGPAAGAWTATAPGLAIGLFYGLTEPVSLALAAGGFLAFRRERWGAASALLAGACLARESSVLFVAGLAAALAWDRRWRAASTVAAGAIPAFLYAAWLARRVGPVPDGALAAMTCPFAGVWNQVRQDLSPAGGPLLHALPVWYAAAWCALAGAAGLTLLRERASRPWGLLMALHAAFLLCTYQEVWSTVVNAGRLSAGLSLSAAAAGPGGSRLARWAFWGALPLHAAVLARLVADVGLPYTLS